MGSANYETASMEEVLEWIRQGIFSVHLCEETGETQVWKGEKELSQRINKRKGSERGDPRVDLRHNNKRRSVHVSQLVWMVNLGEVIPRGWEIHHRNEDPLDNRWENLICLHPSDHLKLHTDNELPSSEGEEEIPF